MKDVEKPQISEETFGSTDEHVTIDDDGLAEAVRALAMREMATAKVPVKTNSHAEKVEFFWLDVKKDKKIVQQLNKLLAVHRVQLLWRFEKSVSNGPAICCLPILMRPPPISKNS